MPWEELPQELLEEEVLLIEKVTYDTWSQYAKDKMDPPHPQIGWSNTKKKLLWKQGNLFMKTKGVHKMVVAPDNALTIIKAVHEEGHAGFEITRRKLKDAYFIPGAKKDIKKVIDNCEICQRNQRMLRRTEELHPIAVTEPMTV
ncbi:hypothetical protein AYI69_g7192 [Smittium culicis]|nr:hypothetical protein AYI69_g7192 [Smittium culicis]